MNQLDKTSLESHLTNFENRKTRSLYKWLAKITGVKACWIEGVDNSNRPLWGFIKKLIGGRVAIVSRKLSAICVLGIMLSFTSNLLFAQTAIDLNQLRGVNGFILEGLTNSDDFGFSTASGDINGDGIDDVIIGAPLADPNSGSSGETFVLFGSTSGFSSTPDLSSLDGTTGFVINGESFNNASGRSVSTGDINGDNIDDVIIGANQADSFAGRTYVVFGKSTSFTSSIELSSLNGTTGFVLNGIDGEDNSGYAVSSGDINGDNYDDVIIGANQADPGGDTEGETYVFFGGSSFASSIELSSLNGSTGFVLNGTITDGRSGFSVSSGDINGDNFYDVIIGAPFPIEEKGSSYVVFGNSSFASSINLSSLDGSTGFVLNGIDITDFNGTSVASGDINGDGTDDVIIGATGGDPNALSSAGETYVVFGSSSFASSFDLSSLNGTTGFVLNGVDFTDQSGSSVASGDINGDGTDDVIIGAVGGDPASEGEAGESYVVFGSSSFASSVDLSSLNGTTGFVLYGIDQLDNSGRSVSSGDINGDGTDDLIIGAAEADNLAQTFKPGHVYVFFNTAPVSITGDEGFRLLSAPVSGAVFDELLAPFWTQGFDNSDESVANGNLWKWDQESQLWSTVKDQNTTSLETGEGFLFYIFSDDNGPDVAGDSGFPKRISATQFGGNGSFNNGNVTNDDNAGLNQGDFILTGNPYGFTIDWDSTSIIKDEMSNTIYMWDDAASAWQSWNGTTGGITDGLIHPYQGFFAELSDNGGTLEFKEGAISDATGTFFKAPAQSSQTPKVLKIHAEAGEFQSTAWLSFQEEGALSKDRFDAHMLQPLGDSYLQLGMVIENDQVLSINAIAIDHTDPLSFQLELKGITEQKVAQVSFEGLEHFSDWNMYVLDTHTDKEYPLKPGEVIELDITMITSKQVPVLRLPTPVPLKAKASESRYTLILQPHTMVNNEENVNVLPLTAELQQNYPNPFNPSTSIAFGVPKQGFVRLEIYDIMGRKVHTLFEGTRSAGRYNVTFDASNLSSGTYIYRLQTTGYTLTKKMILIK